MLVDRHITDRETSGRIDELINLTRKRKSTLRTSLGNTQLYPTERIIIKETQCSCEFIYNFESEKRLKADIKLKVGVNVLNRRHLEHS